MFTCVLAEEAVTFQLPNNMFSIKDGLGRTWVCRREAGESEHQKLSENHCGSEYAGAADALRRMTEFLHAMGDPIQGNIFGLSDEDYSKIGFWQKKERAIDVSDEYELVAALSSND